MKKLTKHDLPYISSLLTSEIALFDTIERIKKSMGFTTSPEKEAILTKLEVAFDEIEDIADSFAERVRKDLGEGALRATIRQSESLLNNIIGDYDA